MVDMLTRVFMTFASQGQVRKEIRTHSICSTLLVGEHNMSRSLLLLTAVTAASQLGVKVVFFTHTHIQQLPTFLQKRAPVLDPESLKKIRFCYPGTLEELLQQVAGLHESSSTSPTPPSLIVVDRLEAYLCGPGGSRQAGFRMDHLSRAAHLSALLCDTAVFLRRGSSSSSPCQVIASYQPEDDSGQAGGQTHTSCSVLHVLDRFFQARCTLTRDESYEAEAAGLQEIWHIYVSLDFNGERCEDRKGDDQEWQLLVAPGGVMEFQMV